MNTNIAINPKYQILIQYVRNRKGQLAGAVVATGLNQIGWSLCCKKDVFDKSKALDIATRRATVGSVVPLPHCVRPLVEKMKTRAAKYYKAGGSL